MRTSSLKPLGNGHARLANYVELSSFPPMTFPVTAYFEAAMELAHYDKLEDGTFAGEIPKLAGVAAFGSTLKECERQLRSTLEDWVLVGLRLGHRLPKLAGIDLNKRGHGRMASSQKA